MFWPCETRTSTCRSFATISSGLYRFLAIAVLLDVKDIPQVGPLQWGWITWPSLIWHLYDYNLEPAGGYFGTKKANESIHILYSYDDHSIAVVNSTYKPVRGLTASVRVIDFDLKELFSKDQSVDVDADGVRKVLQIPEVPSNVKPTVYFIQLKLKDATGRLLCSNF